MPGAMASKTTTHPKTAAAARGRSRSPRRSRSSTSSRLEVEDILRAHSALLVRQEDLLSRAELIRRQTARLRADTARFDVDKSHMLLMLRGYDDLAPEAQGLLDVAFGVAAPTS